MMLISFEAGQFSLHLNSDLLKSLTLGSCGCLSMSLTLNDADPRPAAALFLPGCRIYTGQIKHTKGTSIPHSRNELCHVCQFVWQSGSDLLCNTY